MAKKIHNIILKQQKHSLCRVFSKSNKGFTLTEIIITVFILSILCTIIMPSIRLVERHELIAAASTLKSDIEYIQRMSIIESKEYSVVLKATGYDMYDGSGALPFKERRLPSLKRYSCKIGFSNSNEIRFTASGTTKHGAGEIVLYSDNYLIKLTMSLGSGRIKIHSVILE